MSDHTGEQPDDTFAQDMFLENISLEIENASQNVDQIAYLLGHIGVEARLNDAASNNRNKLIDITDKLAALATKALNLREDITNTIDLSSSNTDNTFTHTERPFLSVRATSETSPATSTLAFIHFCASTLQEARVANQIITLPSGREVPVEDVSRTLVTPDELPDTVLSRFEVSTIEFLSDSLISFDGNIIQLGTDRRLRSLLNVLILRQGHPSAWKDIKELGFPLGGNDKSTKVMFSKTNSKLSRRLKEAAERDVIVKIGAGVNTRYLLDRPVRVIDHRKPKKVTTT